MEIKRAISVLCLFKVGHRVKEKLEQTWVSSSGGARLSEKCHIPRQGIGGGGRENFGN
jgi:hypothetical protein